MKNNKISMLVAAGMTMATALVMKPATVSLGATIHHKEVNQKTKKVKSDNTVSGNKENVLKGMDFQKVNIFTGKVIKTTDEEKKQELNIVFNGSNHMSYYNGKDLNPDMEQTKFHSKTQEELYKYLMNPNNRWAAENEAIGLHGGDIYNDCVFFVSSALRNIGVSIPNSIGYTSNLMNELQSLGWEKETDLSTLEAGDICFAGTAHTYVFMGWANKEDGIAWVCDNQFSWYGTNFHPRDQHSEINENVSPTTCYYRLPESYVLGGNPNKVDMPVNYDYKVGTVAVSELNLRSEANLNGSIIATVTEGTRVQILGQAGSWYKINYNGQTAYGWANYINGSVPTVTNPYEIIGKNLGTGVIDFEGNTHTAIQNGPTWNSKYLGDFGNGTKVNIVGESGEWYKVQSGNTIAWVLKYRVKTSLNKEVPKSKKSAEKKVTKTKNTNGADTVGSKIIGTGVINFVGNTHTAIQSGPTWNSKYLGDFENGTKVNILGESGGWYKVQSGNTIAWVLKYRVDETLNKESSTNKKTEVKKENEIKKVSGVGVIHFKGGPFTDIQKEATWNSDFVGELTNGTKVSIVSEQGNWYEIKNGDGLAWVLKDRVQTNVSDKVIGTGVINFEGNTHTAIQSGPTWDSEYLGDLENGESVKIIGQSGDWYEVEHGTSAAWVLKYRVNINANTKVLGKGIVDFNGGTFTDIQEGPTWNSNFAGTLNNGTKVAIVSEKGSWFEIENGNGTAWILKSRVNNHIGDKVIGTGIINFIGDTHTAIQSGPTWDSAYLGDLQNGASVKIIGQNGNWYEVENGDGTAWVLKYRVNVGANLKVLGTGIIDFTGGPVTNVQDEPTWESGLAEQLANGTEVSIVSEKGDWFEIKDGNGLAWVLKKRVESSVGAKVIGTGMVYLEGNTHTAIQSRPTWNSKYLGDLENGTIVKIIGESNGWYKVENGNGIAWVLKYRVNTNVHQILGKGIITFAGGPYTDIQGGPSWQAAYKGSLTNGSKVVIVGEKDSWYEIENGDNVAWVLKNRVNTDLNKGVNPIIKTGYVKFSGGDFTDVVSGPSWNYSFVGEINNGTEIRIIAENGAWYKIKYKDGTAWVLKDRVSFKKPEANITYKYVNYGTSMSNYVNEEVQNYINCFGGDLSQSRIDNARAEIANAVNPSNAKTKYEFLRIDRYRQVNYEKFQELLQGKGVFSGQAQGFINAAKEYNIDPVYLLAQSALETGWGTSNFAQGIRITQIANENAPIYQNGNLVGYQMINLSHPVTVYDLFGIGADDSNGYFPNKATILGTTYAYNHGWTSVANALKGAAQFLSENYVHNTDIAQNTPFEIRYINAPSGDIWHQYASEVNYGEEIASIIAANSDLYSNSDNFTFDVPQFS